MSIVTRADNPQGAEIVSLKERKTVVDLKGSVFTLTVLRLYSSDLDQIEQELRERIAQGPRFFEDAPVVIDLESVRDSQAELDFAQLAPLLRRLKLIPVGVRHGNLNQQLAAVEAGLALMKGGSIRELPMASNTPNTPNTATATIPAKSDESTPAVQTRIEAVTAPVTATATEKGEKSGTRTIYQPIRSGQQTYARNGDLIVLAAVNAGAEVVADGNIHVYAPLRGRALAGIHGDPRARIFCQSFEAELVSLAGHYRVFEEKVPAELYRKAVQIYLNDKDQLTIEPLA